ncbi:hypothetical protein CF335_g9167, partial [Tilletia laevis]
MMLLGTVNDISRRLTGLENRSSQDSPVASAARQTAVAPEASLPPVTPVRSTNLPSHMTPAVMFPHMTPAEQDGLSSGLRSMGIRFEDFVNMVHGRASTPHQDSPLLARSRSTAFPTSSNDLPPSTSTRVPLCRPEFIGRFHGDPTHLENFLSRVRAVARSNTNPEWVMSVVRTLPIVMEDDAAVWHAGLTDEEAASMTTLTVWQDKLREAFPVNRYEQRRNARNRQWNPADEGASAYFFYKLRLLRGAYGPDQNETNLTHDILDGLPPEFRVMLRLPRHNVSLNDVRQEISEWEPMWRELHRQSRSLPSSSTARTSGGSPPGRDSRLFPASTSYAVAPSTVTAPAAGPRPTGAYVPLAVSYDPGRIIPATATQPRKYRRPDNNKVIDLDRACDRCGELHFNFEHNHLQVKAQARVVNAEDDYPE